MPRRARYNEAVLQTEAAISVITAHQLFTMTFAYDSFEICVSLFTYYEACYCVLEPSVMGSYHIE